MRFQSEGNKKITLIGKQSETFEGTKQLRTFEDISCDQYQDRNQNRKKTIPRPGPIKKTKQNPRPRPRPS